jgi:hypothetical protein
MSDNNNGCFINMLGFVVLIIGIIVWINNVTTIKITEQLPPPEDSWSVVYPQFRDDVSAQLLNTQKISGSVLDSTSYLKTQNADLQNSVDLLLNNLGIMKQESRQESIRQRNQNIITTILSVIFGWLLGVMAPPESMKNLRKRIFQRPKKNSNVATSNNEVAEKNVNKDVLLAKENLNVATSNNEVAEKNVNKAVLLAKKNLMQTKTLPISNVVDTKFPQTIQSLSGKLCPQCGIAMEIRTDNYGKRYFVCKNVRQCKQYFPVD